MGWTIEQMLELAKKNKIPLTREQAATQAYCFNEAAKRKTSPIAVLLELQKHQNALDNIGKPGTTNNKLTPNKPSWQL